MYYARGDKIYYYDELTGKEELFLTVHQTNSKYGVNHIALHLAEILFTLNATQRKNIGDEIDPR